MWQASEEEAEQKELQKDLNAITALISQSRATALALSKLDYTSEMQQDLKEKTAAVQQHQEALETMVDTKGSPSSN